MHYALDLRTFIHSHYFSMGFRIACGIMLSSGIFYYWGNQDIAMTAFLGAFCTSVMDLPSPLRHKFNEMIAGLLLCTFTTFVITLCAAIPLLMSIVVIALCFLLSMTLVYGKKTASLQVAALVIMAASLQNNFPASHITQHIFYFFAGGMIYLAFALSVCFFMRYRFKEQILSESFFELSKYLRIRADFYDIRADLTEQFNLLVQQQIILADKQQEARDVLFRDIEKSHDGRLIQIHLTMLDLYDHIISTNTDYVMLRKYFGDSDILIFMRDLAKKIAADIEDIALSLTCHKCAQQTVNYQAELRAIEYALIELEQHSQFHHHYSTDAVAVLHTSYYKIKDMIERMHHLRKATTLADDAPAALSKIEITPFLTQQKYKWELMRSHFDWKSPFFRFAIRLSFAVLIGIWVGHLVPYTSRPHWIAITIIIILKPNFSLTKQRLRERFLGTAIGCVIAFSILYLFDSRIVLFVILFLASIAAPTFANIKYIYTAIAATIQVIILVNLFLPDTGNWFVSERVIDTAIGLIIAFIFSYVLPSWEYLSTKTLLKNVLDTNQKYIDASRTLFENNHADDFFYRISRKDFMNSLSLLIDMLIRMSKEPAQKQYANKELNAFVIQNYLVASHIAALRILLKRYQGVMPEEDVKTLLSKTLIEAHYVMTDTAAILGTCDTSSEENLVAPDAPPLFVLESEKSGVENWSAWDTLMQRTELLLGDLQSIQKQTQAICSILHYSSVPSGKHT